MNGRTADPLIPRAAIQPTALDMSHGGTRSAVLFITIGYTGPRKSPIKETATASPTKEGTIQIMISRLSYGKLSRKRGITEYYNMKKKRTQYRVRCRARWLVFPRPFTFISAIILHVSRMKTYQFVKPEETNSSKGQTGEETGGYIPWCGATVSFSHDIFYNPTYNTGK